MKTRFEQLKDLLSGGATDDKCLFCCEDNQTIVRGSSKDQSFRLPCDRSLLKNVIITYKQLNSVVLEIINPKSTNFDSKLISYSLSESETFRFVPGELEIQLKASLEDKSIILSDIYKVDVINSFSDKRILDDNLVILSMIANVELNEVELVQFNNMICDSENEYVCRINLDSTWSQFTTRNIYFIDEYNNEIKCEFTLNSFDNIEITIPNNVLENPGKIYVLIEGILETEAKTIIRRTNISNSIRVDK